MTCPYFLAQHMSGTATQCNGVLVPFEPSWADEKHFCLTGRYRHCPLYRSAVTDCSLAINQEVARAIG